MTPIALGQLYGTTLSPGRVNGIVLRLLEGVFREAYL
jgi:hypothetical protein